MIEIGDNLAKTIGFIAFAFTVARVTQVVCSTFKQEIEKEWKDIDYFKKG